MDPNFFGLSGNPFAKSDNADASCLTEEHLALTAELQAGLKAPHGITLLIGEEGAGKTTFIRSFLAQLPDSYVVAYLPTAGPGLRHLLTEIIEQLGGTVAPGGQEQALIDTVRALAKARAEHERATLVVIDDAHELPAKTIERLGKLFGADAADPSRLHVTLVGRPELLDRMNAANDRSILKHLVQVCRMDSIGPEDAFRYIADRVQRVGGIVDHVFSEEALRMIVQRANGNPARIGQLCTAALERAEGRGVASVDVAAVEAASNGVEICVSGEAGVASEKPETPTYFFNEDDEAQRADEGPLRVPADATTLPREGTAVAVPASTRRLAYWAGGAIVLVVALALAMTSKETPLGGSPSTEGGDEAVKTAAADKSRPPDTSAGAETSPGVDEPGAVPKLVVKRGTKGAAARLADTPEAPTGAEAAAAPAAQAAPEAAATERPRFPAPPLQPAAEAAVKQPAEPVAKPPQQAEAAIPTAAPPTPAAVASKAVEPAPEPAKPQAAAAVAASAPPPAAKTHPAAQAATPATQSGEVPTAAPASPPVVPTRPAATAAAKPTLAPPAPVQTAAAAKPAAGAASSAGRYTVQLGAFSTRANAEALLAKARPAASDGRIIASSVGAKPVFRVVAGSFATQVEADARAAALKKSGYTTFVKKLD